MKLRNTHKGFLWCFFSVPINVRVFSSVGHYSSPTLLFRHHKKACEKLVPSAYWCIDTQWYVKATEVCTIMSYLWRHSRNRDPRNSGIAQVCLLCCLVDHVFWLSLVRQKYFQHGSFQSTPEFTVNLPFTVTTSLQIELKKYCFWEQFVKFC